MRHDTGEIVAGRSQLAEALGVHPNHVGNVLAELASIGAVLRDRGPRGSRWLMNPNVATCLAGKARDDAQSAAPELRLVP
jgi:DNA-binding IscR family transcriptional regulator